MSDEQGKQIAAIFVEYEIWPLRAIYRLYFADDGQTDDEVRATYMAENPSHRIRKIGRENVEGL